jgi:hypothetical protein
VAIGLVINHRIDPLGWEKIMELAIVILTLVLFSALAMRFGADSRDLESDTRNWPADSYAQI